MSEMKRRIGSAFQVAPIVAVYVVLLLSYSPKVFAGTYYPGKKIADQPYPICDCTAPAPYDCSCLVNK